MGEPNVIVPIALVVFLLVVGVSFAFVEPRRAVLVTTLGGWLFLPHFDERYKFLILGSKATFVGAAVLTGSLLLDGKRWRGFRPKILDLPVVVLCVGPFVTSLYNGLGAYEAAAATFDSAMTWGAPYLLGRLYLGQPRALRDAADALVVAALVYVPLCLWEVRMSPQLHSTIYGFRPFSFDQAYRWGGFRPSVFMQHGLAAGMFMASGTLIAFWIWRTGARPRIAGLPLGWASLLLAVTTVLSKSTGAIILLAVGVTVLEGTRAFRTPALLLALLLVPIAYCAARVSGWNGETLVAISRDAIDVGRSQSLEFRLHNEDILIKKAMMRPWLGWGRYGRSFFLENEDGDRETAITDGYWVLVLGIRGFIGLFAMGTPGDPAPRPALGLSQSVLEGPPPGGSGGGFGDAASLGSRRPLQRHAVAGVPGHGGSARGLRPECEHGQRPASAAGDPRQAESGHGAVSRRPPERARARNPQHLRGRHGSSPRSCSPPGSARTVSQWAASQRSRWDPKGIRGRRSWSWPCAASIRGRARY